MLPGANMGLLYIPFPPSEAPLGGVGVGVRSLQPKNEPVMRKILDVFVGSFVWLFLYCSAVYFVLNVLLGMQRIFGTWYRMFLYHYAHPYQYIALFCMVYAAMLALLLALGTQRMLKKRWVLIVLPLMATVVLASMVGGALWKIHDMQAGHFTEGARFWTDLGWGVSSGLQLGWLLLLASFPFNLLCLPAFAVAAIQSGRYVAHRGASD